VSAIVASPDSRRDLIASSQVRGKIDRFLGFTWTRAILIELVVDGQIMVFPMPQPGQAVPDCRRNMRGPYGPSHEIDRRQLETSPNVLPLGAPPPRLPGRNWAGQALHSLPKLTPERFPKTCQPVFGDSFGLWPGDCHFPGCYRSHSSRCRFRKASRSCSSSCCWRACSRASRNLVVSISFSAASAARSREISAASAAA
jgi:hypothetical protein